MAWPDEAQALVVEKFGPSAPKLMLATPEGMLAMAMGMKKGLRRPAPRDRRHADLVDERARAAQAGGHQDAGLLCQLALQAPGQAGVVHGLAGGHEGHLRGAVVAADLLAVEHDRRGRSRAPRRRSGWPGPRRRRS